MRGRYTPRTHDNDGILAAAPRKPEEDERGGEANVELRLLRLFNFGDHGSGRVHEAGACTVGPFGAIIMLGDPSYSA